MPGCVDRDHVKAVLRRHRPVTRTSGSSIKGEHPARTGNRKLRRALFLAAFAALSDPVSGTYRNKAYYRHPEPTTTPAPA